MPGKHKSEWSLVNEAAPLNESGSLKPEQPLKDNCSVDVWLLPNKQQRADGAGHSKIIAVSRLSQEFTEQWWARAVSRVHGSNAPVTSRAGWSQILGIEENFECSSCSNTTQTAHKRIQSWHNILFKIITITTKSDCSPTPSVCGLHRLRASNQV